MGAGSACAPPSRLARRSPGLNRHAGRPRRARGRYPGIRRDPARCRQRARRAGHCRQRTSLLRMRSARRTCRATAGRDPGSMVSLSRRRFPRAARHGRLCRWGALRHTWRSGRTHAGYHLACVQAGLTGHFGFRLRLGRLTFSRINISIRSRRRADVLGFGLGRQKLPYIQALVEPHQHIHQKSPKSRRSGLRIRSPKTALYSSTRHDSSWADSGLTGSRSVLSWSRRSNRRPLSV